MAILNPFDILDADEENPTKLLESFERKKAEQLIRMIALARNEAEAEDIRWEATQESNAIKENRHKEYLKEKERKEQVRKGIAQGRVASGNGQGKRGYYSRNNGNGNYNRTLENGVNNKANGKGDHQIGYRNGNVGGDKARSYQRNRKEKIEIVDAGNSEIKATSDEVPMQNRKEKIENVDAGNSEIKATSDEVPMQDAVEIAKADDTSSSPDKLVNNEGSLESNPEKHVKKVESLESDGNKDKEEEVKTYTLTEYKKILEEKRKPLLAMMTNDERKVLHKEFESMHQVSHKKENDEIFIKLRSEKGGQDKRVKKALQGKAQVSDDNKVKNAVLKVFQVKSRPRPQFRETYGTQTSAPASLSNRTNPPMNGSVGGQLSSPSSATSNGTRSSAAPSNGNGAGSSAAPSDANVARSYAAPSRGSSYAAPSNGNRNQVRDSDNVKRAPAIENAKDFPPLK